MSVMLDRIQLFCFAACYTIALGLQAWHYFRPRPIFRMLSVALGGVGLLTQTVYLIIQQPTMTEEYGRLLVLAWILAIFYLYGALHHPKLAWGLFVLPVVLGLVIIAYTFGVPTDPSVKGWAPFRRPVFLREAHNFLMLLASVGICVAFVASAMYLVQSRRLRKKSLPDKGIKLPSLERLEDMNRRGLVFSFPMLTLGMFFGVLLTVRSPHPIQSWTDLRVISTGILWLVFALLLYLRYGQHLRGRRAAMLTITAFILLIVTMILPHVSRGGA